jgi:peptidyl-prolyl isomerase D
LETDSNDCPKSKVTILNCGALAEGEDDGVPVDPHSDIYPDYPEDYEGDKSAEHIVTIARALRTLGNEAFKKMEYRIAYETYDKVL